MQPRSVPRLLVCALGLLAGAGSFAAPIPADQLSGLTWRSIGPFRGGRVSAVAGIPGDASTFYIGLPQGGVWKTTSAGQTWFPVFDGVKDVCSVGSVQVAPSNHDVVYAGTGEISGGGTGNGIYKSSDAGKSWRRVGLEDTKQIPCILVDPHNENTVLAAATGSSSDAIDARGVFRSADGGATWKRTLAIDNATGVHNIAWAYDNPSVVYAVSMRRYRKPDAKPDPSQGSGVAVYKSTDEGLTWKKVSGTGLPPLTGRSTICVAMGTHSQRLYLIGTWGLYTSEDGGSTWHQLAKDDNRIANGQGDYSSGVYADPQNPDIIYTIATCVFRSADGGKTFEGFKGAPGGDDPHFLWIDPTNGRHLLLGGDQGATVSLDGGGTWGSWYNQPTGQLYHITVDNQWPYWVYGTQQDSGGIGTATRGNLGNIGPMDWTTNMGFEFGYVLVDPLNPRITFGLGPDLKLVKIMQPSGQWSPAGPHLDTDNPFAAFPGQMGFSEANPHELLGVFGRLMSTTDGGAHWTAISPDFPPPPKPKTAPGAGPIFAPPGVFVTSFVASPADKRTLWIATSNGLIEATRDHGATWSNVTPSLANAKDSSVAVLAGSYRNPAIAYAVVTRMEAGKPKTAYVRTRDFGKTWQEIGKALSSGPGEAQSRLLVRCDPKREGLLYGLDTRRLYVSFDSGDTWQSLNLNLPYTQLSDLVVHGDDLVLCTYGRGLWVLDDVSPLREMTPSIVAEPVHLYKPGLATRVRRNLNGDTPMPPEIPHAMNPPLGAVIYYELGSKPAQPITIDILDQRGKVVRHMSSEPIQPYDDPVPPVPAFWLEQRKPLPTEVGLNRVNWNLRYDTPDAFNHDAGDVMGAGVHDTPAAIEGPLVLPDAYTVRLTVDGHSMTQPLTVRNDPRSDGTDRDMRLMHDVQMRLCAAAAEAFKGHQLVEDLLAQVDKVTAGSHDEALAKATKAFKDKLSAIGGTVSHERRFSGPPDAGSFVGANGNILFALDTLDYGDLAPTDTVYYAEGSEWSKLKLVADRWRALLSKDLPVFNAALAKAGLTTLSAPSEVLVDSPAPPKKYLPAKSAPGAKAGNIDLEELKERLRDQGGAASQSFEPLTSTP